MNPDDSVAAEDRLKSHPVVPHEGWLSARTALLAKEKEFTRLRDEISRHRRELPWERVEQKYVFDGPSGSETLAQLFGKCTQLIVYHFMYGPYWDAGCKSCSFWADNFNGIDVHMRRRDTEFVAISRAPYEKLRAYRQRMGWTFKWLSSHGNSFNFDYLVSFMPEQVASGQALSNYGQVNRRGSEVVGISVFYKGDTGEVYHTYSTYARGVDMLNGAYHYLDLTPKGRDEEQMGQNRQAWVQRRDEYKD
jgi:predicted dithiol-disulfide oxidoreductase (DUF899 family)